MTSDAPCSRRSWRQSSGAGSHYSCTHSTHLFFSAAFTVAAMVAPVHALYLMLCALLWILLWHQHSITVEVVTDVLKERERGIDSQTARQRETQRVR